MNKNYPILAFFFVMSLSSSFFMESWFVGWMLLELNTITFLGFLAPSSFKTFFKEAPLNFFMAQSISSIFLILSLYMMMYFKMFYMGNNLLMMAILFKMAFFPFQGWFVMLVLNISWLFFFLMITLQKIIPLLFLEMSKPEINLILLIIVASTLLWGSVSNATANSMKTLLLFSSITNTGWLLISSMISSSIWKIFFSFYVLFLMVIFFQSLKQSQNNLITYMSLLGIAGLPPLISFFPKIFIIIILVKENMSNFVLLLLFSSLLDFYYYARSSYPSLFKSSPIFKNLTMSTNQMTGTFLIFSSLFFIFLW